LQSLQCYAGIKLRASGEGNNGSFQGMELWIDAKLAARWNALKIYRQYEYGRDFSCGPHTIDLVNAGNATLRVYRLEADCAVFLSEDRPVDPVGSLRYTYIKDCNETCALRGDTMPCGSVSLDEVISLINKWTNDEAALVDVVRLISVWSASN
jgi:hypothetical protein